MDINEVQNLTRQLVSVPWGWNADDWDRIAARLNLRRPAIVGSRKDYRKTHDSDFSFSVSAYFSESAIEAVDSIIDITDDFYHLTYEEYVLQCEEYDNVFNAVVDAVTEVMGAPLFRGDSESEDFPEDAGGSAVALWEIQNARFCVALEHQDEQGRMDVSIRIIPPQEVNP